jgi:hypothetical protein
MEYVPRIRNAHTGSICFPSLREGNRHPLCGEGEREREREGGERDRRALRFMALLEQALAVALYIRMRQI